MSTRTNRQRARRLERRVCGICDEPAGVMRHIAGRPIPLCSTCNAGLDILAGRPGEDRGSDRTKFRILMEMGTPRRRGEWPDWATTAPENVNDLVVDDRGPWVNISGLCRYKGYPEENVEHPAELPNTFYCRRHMEIIRTSTTAAKRRRSRDLGLCEKCGEPSRLMPRARTDREELCIQAEMRNLTVAGLCSTRRCRDCS